MAMLTRPAFIPLPEAEAFPADMLTLRHWVAYDLEERSAGWTKVPINPHTGRYARSNDPQTWGTFAEARAVAARGGIGVGFMLAPPLFGFDLDGCIENGALSSLATSVLGELHTYAETSVSGTGVKGIGIGKKPSARCRRNGLNLEIYDHARLFALTGQCLPDAPLAINDCQEGLDFIHGVAFRDEQPPATVAWDPAAVTNDDDRAVIDWLHNYKNGGRFAAYWNAQDGDNPSSGDQGMANMIAWRVGPDPARIEAIFNVSARAVREKWQQRPAYRASTIRNAIDRCSGRFYEARPLPSTSASPVEPEQDEDPTPSAARLRARVEELERENAEWRRKFASAQKMLANVVQIRRNIAIKAERDTLTACILHIAGEQANGRADAEGWVRQPAQTVADSAGKGVAAARTHRARGEEWGLLELKLVTEYDQQNGQRRTVTYARTKEPPEQAIDTLVSIVPTREAKCWGGKREPCPRCGSQRRRTVVTCADCHMEFSDSVSEPQAPAEEPESIPPTPVIVPELAPTYAPGAVTYHAAAPGPVQVAEEAEDSDDQADDWDPYQCNHVDQRGERCTARIDPALGKRYCWQHQRASATPPVAASPDPVRPIAFRLGGVRVGPPPAAPSPTPAAPVAGGPLPRCLARGCAGRVERRSDRYCHACANSGEGYENGPEVRHAAGN
jgi:hypothetical protein